jgi:repressor LexA
MDPKFIQARLEKLGKSKGGLAIAMGLRNSAVTEILAGEREIKARELPALVSYLELNQVPVMGRIGAGAVIEPEFEQVPPEGLSSVEVPFPMIDEMVGFQVVGDSMLPRYDEGDVIVCWAAQRKALESYFGQEVAVRTSTGKRFLKTLTRGKGKGVTLTSFNAKPIENAKVLWIGEIHVVVRASQVHAAAKKAKARLPGRA